MANIKVCLDAGHYGKYNRSPVVKSYYESDMNWKLHNYLKAELESYGITVVQTRTNQDKDLALTTRGKVSKGCDLFLSIHSNASGTESTDYPLVIVQLDGKGDKLGNQLAECIESVMKTKQDGRITKRKGISGEYYGVLRGAAAVGTMGMILEHSFHTNTNATNWLLKDDNLKKLAVAEAKVIAEYFGLEKNTSTNTSTNTTNTTTNNTPDTANPFLVKVIVDELNIRKDAGVGNPIVGVIKDKGTYTIVKTKKISSGAIWGLLKAYRKNENGWINIGSSYVKKV